MLIKSNLSQNFLIQTQYNPQRVSQYFDTAGIQEWHRLLENPTKEVALHVHTHYLNKFVCPGDRVLEVGAGAGRFTQILAQLGARIVVSDLSSVQLNLNRQQADEYGYTNAIEAWEQLDMCDMAGLVDNSFDCVVAYGGPFSYVLDQRDIALAECLRVLRPGGLLILSVVSLWGSTHRNLDRMLGIDPFINQQIISTGDILPGMIADHEQSFHMFRASELRGWLEQAGLQVLAMSASDCLASCRVADASEIRSDPEKWNELLRMEVEACAEQESWNMGMHTIAVAWKGLE
jgi:SAM-dependent methyltransferase